MADTKRANRQVCDVDIYILKTMAPYLYFDTANTTSTSMSADSVYAMAKRRYIRLRSLRCCPMVPLKQTQLMQYMKNL